MPDLERVLQSTPTTLSQQWYEDGAVVNPGTVTIGIAREDGTTLVAAGTATSGTTTAPRTYAITTTHTALLDRLKVTWTSSAKGTLVSYLEVVGGFLFSVNQARQDPVLSNATTYPTARLLEARTWAEQEIEDSCGVAFVPRYARETLSSDNGYGVQLKWPKIRALRAAHVDGTALTSTQMTDVVFTSIGFYRRYANWNRGVSNLVLGYEHGFDYPPGEITRAAIRLVKHQLEPSQFGDDRIVRAQAGEESFTFASSRNGGWGIPDVDRAVSNYNYRLPVA